MFSYLIKLIECTRRQLILGDLLYFIVIQKCTFLNVIIISQYGYQSAYLVLSKSHCSYVSYKRKYFWISVWYDLQN